MKVSDVRKNILTYITKLQQSKTPGVRFRIAAWKKVYDQLLPIKNQLTKNKINKLNITNYMKKTLTQMIEGTVLEEKVNPKEKLIYDLTQIKGIGLEKARDLINHGLNKLSQLKQKKFFAMLNTDTQMFLTLKPKEKIPYDHITQIASILNIEKIPNIHIAGSYRRKKPFSSDIDIVYVGSIKKLMNLISLKFPIHVYAKGIDKASIILDVSSLFPDTFYKMDLFSVKKQHEIPMLLYATGSATNNIIMRNKAKAKNLLLNQKGLFDRKTKKRLPLKTEKDYFIALDMDYLPPEKR